MNREHWPTATVPTFSNDVLPAASTRIDRWALERIQRSVDSAAVRFMLWDGFALPKEGGTPVATVLIKNRRALFSWVWDPDLNFGEAYMSGAIEIRGDLVKLLEEIYRALAAAGPRPRPWWMWRQSNDVREARENVHHHYDLGN